MLIIALLAGLNWYLLDQGKKQQCKLADLQFKQRMLELEMDDVKHVQGWQAQRMDDIARWR